MAAQNQHVCSHCNQEKTCNQFYFKSNRFDNTCKECRRTARKLRYKEGLNEELAPACKDVPLQEEKAKKAPRKQLLSQEDIQKIAEAFLLLESWDAEDTQREVSNSKSIQKNNDQC